MYCKMVFRYVKIYVVTKSKHDKLLYLYRVYYDMYYILCKIFIMLYLYSVALIREKGMYDRCKSIRRMCAKGVLKETLLYKRWANSKRVDPSC